MLYVYQVLIITQTCEIRSIHHAEDCVMCVAANETKENFPCRVRTTSCNTVSLVMKNKRTYISQKLMMIEESKVISEYKE
jgi:hypothetical protein